MRPPMGQRIKPSTILKFFLVIALTATSSVISTVHCTSLRDGQSNQAAPSGEQQVKPAIAVAIASKAKDSIELQAKTSDDKTIESKTGSINENSKLTANGPSEPGKLANESSNEQEAISRRGRSEPPPPSSVTEKPAVSEKDEKLASEKVTTSSASTSKPTEQKGASKSTSNGSKQQLSGKSGLTPASSNKKLPANLGTVTSTGSGGPAHYMSKHDAYSAIAEKHGALAQDAMRKVDKRPQNNLQRFGGIQKASGIGDMMSPFKGITDNGLARTLGASMRSIIKSKYSVPAYLASAVLGAVALMAFYESPISPLPVPPLPEPPVGRFPPEMPNISPNLQVPFRVNGQQQQGNNQYGQNYQRSFQTNGPLGAASNQQQQVLFPGATAQQRQMTSGAGPVQQLAANLISSVGGNRQTAQRKSGLDYDSSSRSFFGGSTNLGHQQQQLANQAKLGSPANNQHSHHKSSGAMNSILSFFGLGANDGSSSPATPVAALANADIHRTSSNHMNGSEQKGQAALSGSHLVNKMKSFFDRPMSHNIWPVEQHAPNHYDQYRRMSIVQALAKDTAFLSSFLAPSRRSTNVTSSAGNQQSLNNAIASASSSGQQAAGAPQVASARMHVDQPSIYSGSSNQPLTHQSQQQPQMYQQTIPLVNTKRASSGYGLMRAADRIGHALLETFTSGLLHRNSQAQVDNVAARKSEEQQQQQQQNALASATSILSDIMSSYNAQQNNIVAQQNVEEHQNKQQPSVIERAEVASKPVQQSANLQPGEQAFGRSDDQSVPSEQQVSSVSPSKSQVQQANPQAPVDSSAKLQPQNQTPLVRKTRSIGHDYPIEPQQPSRATQINNLVDMVSDSYKQNKLLFSFVMNQVGLSHALPYVDRFLEV